MFLSSRSTHSFTYVHIHRPIQLYRLMRTYINTTCSKTRVFLKKIKSFSKKTASFFKKMASFLKNVLIFFATAGTSTSDGNRLHYPGFYLALFAKNKFLLTSFIVLFVYMSYFTKIASSLRLLVTSSKLAPASTESLACACLK